MCLHTCLPRVSLQFQMSRAAAANPKLCLPVCSVSGCGLLRQVLLASPALTRFKAAGCSRLIVSRGGAAEHVCPAPPWMLYVESRVSRIFLATAGQAHSQTCVSAGLQELRLGTVNLGHLDLTSCGHLREVQLSEASSRTSLDRQGAAWQQEGGPPKQKVRMLGLGAARLHTAWVLLLLCGVCNCWFTAACRFHLLQRALMLKGCTSLPEEAKKRLRDAVLGC